MPRPDDGLIHAWLDGQLPPDEAARVEALAATDPEWAAAVAEAHGLVAASSRILSALDHVPAGVVPRGTAVRTGQRLPWWTKIAAAVVVVVGGSVVVMQNTPDGRMPAPATEQGSPQLTLDALKAVVQTPVASAPTAATPTRTPPPVAIARVPAAAPTTGAPSGAGAGMRDERESRREALARQSITPPITPAPSTAALAVEERKDVQDAGRAVAEVSAAKSQETKVARKTAPTAAPTAAPSAELQQAASLGFAQAQNAVPAQRVVAGVSTAQDARQRQVRICYRLVPDSAKAGVAVVMRAVRTDGDTLRLVPVEPNVLLRAWIVQRDGVWRGATVPLPAGRDTIPVIASGVACPAP